MSSIQIGLARSPIALGLCVLIGGLVLSEAALGIAANRTDLLLPYLAGVSVLAFAGVTLLRPRWSVLGLVFVLFTRVSDLYGPRSGALTLNQLLTLLFVVALLLDKVLIRRERLTFDPLLGWMALFGTAIGVSMAGANDQAQTVTELVAYLREILLLFIIINLVPDLVALRRLTWTVVLAGAALSAAAVLYARTGVDFGGLARASIHQLAGNEFGSRLGGPVGEPNEFARLLIPVVPLAAYNLWSGGSRVLRLATLAAVGLIGLVIVLTFSRGGLLALAATIVIMLARWRVRPAQLLCGALLVAGLALVAPSTYTERIEMTVQAFSGQSTALGESDASISERRELLQVGLLVFAEHPLTGVGKGMYLNSYREYAWRVSPTLSTTPLLAHNLPLQIASETGILGLAAFAAAVLAAIRSLRQARRLFVQSSAHTGVLLAEAVEIAIYGYLAASLFLSDGFPRYLWLLFGLTMITRQVALRGASASASRAHIVPAPAALVHV